MIFVCFLFEYFKWFINKIIYGNNAIVIYACPFAFAKIKVKNKSGIAFFQFIIFVSSCANLKAIATDRNAIEFTHTSYEKDIPC